jgi:hypothetical protein
MSIDINGALDQAYGSQIGKMFEIFVTSVVSAEDPNAELAAAGKRFQYGLSLMNQVLAKAKAAAASA